MKYPSTYFVIFLILFQFSTSINLAAQSGKINYEIVPGFTKMSISSADPELKFEGNITAYTGELTLKDSKIVNAKIIFDLNSLRCNEPQDSVKRHEIINVLKAFPFFDLQKSTKIDFIIADNETPSNKIIQTTIINGIIGKANNESVVADIGSDRIAIRVFPVMINFNHFYPVEVGKTSTKKNLVELAVSITAKKK